MSVFSFILNIVSVHHENKQMDTDALDVQEIKFMFLNFLCTHSKSWGI